MTDSAPSTPIRAAEAAAIGAAEPGPLSPAGPLTPVGPLTPAGLQRQGALRARRRLLAALCLASLTALAIALERMLGAGGWTALEIGLAFCVMLTAPWVVFGFWTVLIGFLIRRLHPDPIALVAPQWRDVDAQEPIREKTALLMTLRNEDPRRAFRRLLAIRASLDETPDGAMVDFFILSDTSDPAVAETEERLFAANRAALDGLGTAQYRRRETNAGYKAGNIRDWLERWGDGYVFMAPLDADSVLSGQALRRMMRVVQRHPRLGLLQYLSLGAPTRSAFARMFQFGARLDQVAFAVGASWWQGDCGPFWGHNALVRVAPFKRDCQLPDLKGAPPLGGPLLSHDHVEAALMRRAGYEVRLAPVENESWEDMPVTLLDFLRREVRWANGNMQYVQLLGLPGLTGTDRFKLLQAVMAYVGPAAWMLMIALAGVGMLLGGTGEVDPDLAVGLFFAMLALSLAPKLIGALDVALQPGETRRRGGAGRLLLSSVMDVAFGMLLAPVVAFHVTVFLLGLPFGKKLEWGGQRRDAYAQGWAQAAAALWPQTLLGAALSAGILTLAPDALPFAAPVLLGLLLAIPMAVLSASPRLAGVLERARLMATPDELAPPAILRAVSAARLEETPEPPREKVA